MTIVFNKKSNCPICNKPALKIDEEEERPGRRRDPKAIDIYECLPCELIFKRYAKSGFLIEDDGQTQHTDCFSFMERNFA